MADRQGGALAGIRVLDLGRVLAAPWATQLLADMGAEVIKVERPGTGDLSRSYGTVAVTDAEGNRTRETSFWVCANRNKKSITVDLSKPEGQALIRDLAAECDVLMENFIAGTTRRMGIDYETLRKINPRLVYCSLTGYGQDGPYASRGGYDAVFQAQSGLMNITGIEDGKPGAGPMKTGPSLMDVMAGMNAAVGILGALSYRDRVSGEGQFVDVAMLDTAIACQSHAVAEYLMSGKVPMRRGNAGNGGGPAEVFACADRLIYISAGNDYNYVDLCKVLGVPEMGTDPKFLTLRDRWENRAELTERLAARIATWNGDDLLAALVEAQVPASLVMDYDDVFSDPQVVHRGIRVEMEHPLAASGTVPGIAFPVRLSETPVEAYSHPPLLGEHSEYVLRDILGMNDAAIEKLRANQVV